MSEIANLSVVIGANIADLERKLTTADDKITSFADSLSSKFASLGVGLINVGAQVTAITAPLAAMGKAGIDVASDFQSSMAEISARTGLTGDALANISDVAIQLGADTSFSAGQAADAFLQLLSSGQTTEQALMTIPHILDAAAASGEDLGRTADVVTDIMAAFGVDTEYAGDVVETLSQAAGASSADMASLGEGFANVGGVAKSFGMNVQDTAAVLAIFAENGIKGAEAGTSLKSMLLNMSKTTDETQGAWEELGTSLYDNEGNVRALEDVIAELDTAMDKLPAEEQNRLMKALGGSYGIVGLTALRGSISIQEMRKNMLMQAGVSEVAAARMATFEGRVDSLKGSAESLAITALTPLMDNVLSPLAEMFTGLINDVTDWADANPQLTSTIVAIGAAATLLGPALIAIGTAITLAAPAVGLLAGAFALLTSPVLLVAGAIAGLAYIASQFIDFTALAENIKSGAEEIAGSLSGIDFAAIPTQLLTELNDVLFNMTDDDFAPPISAFINHFQTALSAALVSGDFSFLGTDLGAAISKGFAEMDFSGIQTLMDTHFNEILGVIVTVAGLIFGGPIGLAIGAAKLVSSAIENDFLGIGTFLESSGISTAVNDALTSVKTAIEEIISGVFGGGQPVAVDGGSLFDIKNADDVVGTGGPLGLFISDLQMGFDALKEIAANVWANIGPGFSDLAEGVKGFVENLSGTETEGLLRVLTVIGGAIGGIVGKVAELGSEVFGSVLSAIGDALPSIGSAINDFISAISNLGEGDISGFVSNLFDSFANLGESILKFIGIDIEIPSFDEALAGWQTFADSLGTIISFVGDQIGGVFDNIAVGIRSFIRDIGETVDRAKLAFADIALAINTGDTTAQANWTAAQAGIQGSETAKNLEQQLNDSLTAGNVSIDVSKFITSDPAAIAAKIADPTLIQDALNAALVEGDTATFDVLAPIAMQLGVDTEALVADYQAKLQESADAQVYPVAVTAAVTVNPGSIDLSPIMAGISSAASGAGIPASALPAIPHLAEGGSIASSGLAMVHEGEVVLNPQQQANYGGGNSGGNVVNFSPNMNTEQVIADLERMGIYLRPGMNAA